MNRRVIGRDSGLFFLVQKHPEILESKVIVADWTSSMYPFMRQFLIPVLEAEEELPAIVFFNDGDKLPTKEKKIGSTGGLYTAASGNIDEIILKMQECGEAGKGGDFPENDVEALLHAQKTFPDADYILLIADNGASVRDIELLPQVKKPVHVIAARATGYPRLSYVRMAMKTKGILYIDGRKFEGQALEKLEERLIFEFNTSEKEKKRILKEEERKMKKLKRKK